MAHINFMFENLEFIFVSYHKITFGKCSTEAEKDGIFSLCKRRILFMIQIFCVFDTFCLF